MCLESVLAARRRFHVVAGVKQAGLSSHYGCDVLGGQLDEIFPLLLFGDFHVGHVLGVVGAGPVCAVGCVDRGADAPSGSRATVFWSDVCVADVDGHPADLDRYCLGTLAGVG